MSPWLCRILWMASTLYQLLFQQKSQVNRHCYMHADTDKHTHCLHWNVEPMSDITDAPTESSVISHISTISAQNNLKRFRQFAQLHFLIFLWQQFVYLHFKGSRPKWYISSMLYNQHTPLWSGTLDFLDYISCWKKVLPSWFTALEGLPGGGGGGWIPGSSLTGRIPV